MNIRRACIFLIVVASLAQASSAHGQCFRKLWHSICLDTARNNCWPKPFVEPDRQAVRVPLAMMVDAGWQRQNILGRYHFEPETGKLTEAGELKVQWIVQQLPARHRTILVTQAATPSETAARLAAVKEAAAEMTVDGKLPEVIESNLEPPGSSASYVDAVERKFQAAMPEPKLPQASTTTGTK